MKSYDDDLPMENHNYPTIIVRKILDELTKNVVVPHYLCFRGRTKMLPVLIRTVGQF